MKKFKFITLIIIGIIFHSNLYALIEVDITRGNLNPLPVAVSPLSIDKDSKEKFKKLLTKNGNT